MKNYSQFNEDLFLLDFFQKKNKKNNFFFEFGAWDGVYLSNCRLLSENDWSGCFVELEEAKFNELKKNYADNPKILLLNEKIDYKTKNINSIIKINKINKIDVLSIDVDGNDLLIWKSLDILQSNVVIIEFNNTIPFDTSYEDETNRSIGNSYLAIDNYAKSKEYELIKVTACNLIYSKKDFNNNMIKPITANEVYNICKPIRVGFNNYGEYLFFSNHKLEYKEVFKNPGDKSFIQFQPIPKFLRNLTDINGDGAKLLKKSYSLAIFLLLRPILFINYIFKKFK